MSAWRCRPGWANWPQNRAALALAGAWRAPNGSPGLALASMADAPLDLELTLAPDAHALPREAQLWRIEENGREYIGPVQREQRVFQVQLPVRGACVLELLDP